MSTAIKRPSFRSKLAARAEEAKSGASAQQYDPYDFYDEIRAYYAHPSIRRRIAEYCGATALDAAREFACTCTYFIGHGRYLAEKEHYSWPVKAVDTGSLQLLMDRALDIFRSVPDTEGMHTILDIEYFNHRSLSPLLTRPYEVFDLLEPVYHAILEFFERFEIPVLASFTPSGYHFECKIPFGTGVYDKLVTVGHLEPSLRKRYQTVDPTDVKRDRPTPDHVGLGYSAVGRLLQYATHWVMRRVEGTTELPVTISDTLTGDPTYPDEGISLDTTQYADPIRMRPIRIVYSTHQKHKVTPWRYGGQVAEDAPVFTVVPREDLTLDELLTVAADFDLTIEWAKQTPSRLPTAAEGWADLIDEYRTSRLARFHRAFDTEPHNEPFQWPRTYYAFDTSSYSPEVQRMIATPNPELLVPANIQALCRELYTMDWHPKHIAGLIRAHYERSELNWNVNWVKYDPEARANYWVRTYVGQIIDGLDTVDPATAPAFFSTILDDRENGAGNGTNMTNTAVETPDRDRR